VRVSEGHLIDTLHCLFVLLLPFRSFETVVGVSWPDSFYFSRNSVAFQDEERGGGRTSSAAQDSVTASLSHFFAVQVSALAAGSAGSSGGESRRVAEADGGRSRCQVEGVVHSAGLLHPILNFFYSSDFLARKIRSHINRTVP
jgi:hypothetical protein